MDVGGYLARVRSKIIESNFFSSYPSSFEYTPPEPFAAVKVGNGKFENTQFNSRLQPIQIGLGSSATTQNLLKLNYDYGTANNNGNVKSQTITVPTVGANAGFVAVQSYNYDSLNRLKDATENVTPNHGNRLMFLTDMEIGNLTRQRPQPSKRTAGLHRTSLFVRRMFL